MNQQPLTVNIMTAGMRPGDAIGNYIMSAARILRGWGVRVQLFADSIDPAYAGQVLPSRFYQSTGTAILWFHYSIFADNVAIALESDDFKIMDFHGITPPHLFKGVNAHLEMLCQKGYDLLPQLAGRFDKYICHTEYVREWLTGLDYPPQDIHKIFYCVDTTHFEGTVDPDLETSLSRLEYMVFVGRMVPQKDILAMMEIFAQIQPHRPNMGMVMVGSRELVPKYQRQIDELLRRHGLTDRVMWTGQVNDPAVLGALIKQARFMLITSEWESFCVPIAEAAYFGTPPVVGQEAPLPEVAGPAGLVIDKHQPAAAAKQIADLLGDDARYQALGKTAIDWARQYTDDALAANIRRTWQGWLADGVFKQPSP